MIKRKKGLFDGEKNTVGKTKLNYYCNFNPFDDVNEKDLKKAFDKVFYDFEKFIKMNKFKTNDKWKKHLEKCNHNIKIAFATKKFCADGYEDTFKKQKATPLGSLCHIIEKDGEEKVIIIIRVKNIIQQSKNKIISRLRILQTLFHELLHTCLDNDKLVKTLSKEYILNKLKLEAKK